MKFQVVHMVTIFAWQAIVTPLKSSDYILEYINNKGWYPNTAKTEFTYSSTKLIQQTSPFI